MVGGTVSAQELERLRRALDGGDRPPPWRIVAGHHCPVDIGCAWLDAHRIDNGDELMDVLTNSEVRAYVFGHIHQQAEPRGGVRLYGTPSTCFQFSGDSQSFGFDEAKPGYRWLRLGPDGSVETEIRRVDDYDLALDPMDRDNR